jgi:hypothetical protein
MRLWKKIAIAGSVRDPLPKAEFVPVSTGVTGTTDIEVLDGIKKAMKLLQEVTKCCEP